MSVAKSYAKALYEAAQESGSFSEGFKQIEAELDLFKSVLFQSAGIQVALTAPITTVKEKIELIEALSKKLEISDLVTRFLSLLGKKGRLGLFSEIKDSFSSVCLASEGGVAGRLVAAEALSEKEIGILVKVFSQKLGKKVAFQLSTDPSLLAGMKVTVNGVTYDGTLRSQLQKLRDYFVAGMPGAHA